MRTLLWLGTQSCPHSLWQIRYLTVQVFLSSTDWFRQRFFSWISLFLCSGEPQRFCIDLSVSPILGATAVSPWSFLMHPKRVVDFSVSSALFLLGGSGDFQALVESESWGFFPYFHISSFPVGICLPIKDIWYRPIIGQVRCVGTRKLQVKHLIVILEIKEAIVVK